MNPTFRLGRILGIPVGVNWSVIIIGGLIGWTLAASVLPELAPGSTNLAYGIAGAIVAVVFFVSLLIHEFSHAMASSPTASRCGCSAGCRSSSPRPHRPMPNCGSRSPGR
jgi:uncharacterized membrane protein YeaQ/YmgE (transglycosylase-associated protein family)